MKTSPRSYGFWFGTSRLQDASLLTVILSTLKQMQDILSHSSHCIESYGIALLAKTYRVEVIAAHMR